MWKIYYVRSSSLNLKERNSLPSSDFISILHSWCNEQVQNMITKDALILKPTIEGLISYDFQEIKFTKKWTTCYFRFNALVNKKLVKLTFTLQFQEIGSWDYLQHQLHPIPAIHFWIGWGRVTLLAQALVFQFLAWTEQFVEIHSSWTCKN